MKVIRVAFRVLIRIAGVAGIVLAAGLYFFSFHLSGLVESEVLAALDEMGLPDATLTVSGVGLGRATLTDLDLDGTGKVRIESVEVAYRLADLRAGRVRKVTVTGLTLTLRYADGKLDLGPLGRIETSGEGESTELPFDEIDLTACRLIVETEGRVRHIPIDGTILNTSQGNLDFELTSRFEEQPVEFTGSFCTADLSGRLNAASNGVHLKATLQSIEDRLDFRLEGQRDRLSLFIDDRHFLGERLDFKLSGTVRKGELTRTSIAVSAAHVEFDGRSVQDIHIDFNGTAKFLSGTFSFQCEPSVAGIDLGPDARFRAGGQIGIHPSEEPIRAELMRVQVSLRGARMAGLRGQLDVTLRGEASERGIDLELTEALATADFDAAPGPVTARLGKPGRISATFAEPLDWSATLPAVLLTALPKVAGIEGLEIRGMAKVKAGPDEVIVDLGRGSEVKAAAVRIGGYVIGKIELAVEGKAEVVGRKFHAGMRLLNPVEVTGPAMTLTVSSLEVDGAGRVGEDGRVEAQGTVLATVPEGKSDLSGLRVQDARLELPLEWGQPGQAAPGSLAIGTVGLLGRTFPGPELSLTQEGEGLEFTGKWSPTESAHFALTGDARLTPGGLVSNLEFEAEPFYISPGDVFGGLLVEKSGITVIGVLRAAGRVELDRGHVNPKITLGLSNAEVTYAKDTLALSNVAAEVTIDSFTPLTTPGGQRVTWESARIGEISLGSGLLEYQLEGLDAFSVERARCKLPPQGEFWVHSLRVDPANPDIALELYCQDVSLSRWLDLVAPEQASGEGLLSGRLPVRIRMKPKLMVNFSPGFLHAKPGGWFKIHDLSAVRKLLDENVPSVQGEVDYSQIVKDRVVQALRNFEYSTLRFEIIQNEWDQTLRVTAIGKGREIPEGLKNPQELNLTVNFNGFDTLIGTALSMKLGLDELLGSGR